MNIIRSRLGLKLFFSYLAIILVVMAVIGLAARFASPRAFQRHMMGFGGQFYMRGMMGMHGMEGFQNETMSDLYGSFQASFNEVLIWAVLAATVTAVVVSVFLSRRIVAPLRAMMTASKRIAAGQYDERVPVEGSDEIHELAGQFNQMAEELEQVEARRRRLIGDVAHELRTPLAVIQGSMEGLVDGKIPADRETYEQIHVETQRLSRLVDDLQELSRVEAGVYPLDIRPSELTGIVRVVMKRLNDQFIRKKVNFNSSMPAERIDVQADEDRVIQVLSNLATNALQNTSEGGRVMIEVSRSGREAIVSVIDSGKGIPAEHLPLIFDRFYRVDKSRERIHGGSGIGLTIARHLVQAQGGRIWATSEGESKGSIFSFTLPLVV